MSPSPADQIESGVRVGDFRIERRVGAGGMGIVYLARQGGPTRSDPSYLHSLNPNRPEFSGQGVCNPLRRLILSPIEIVLYGFVGGNKYASCPYEQWLYRWSDCMILADLGQSWGPIVVLAITLVVFGLLGFVILKGYQWFLARSQRAAMRAYDGVAVSEQPAPGLVGVVFHAYSGFLVFVTQVEHRFWAVPDDARLVLSRLHRFNLTWGFFAYGALIIPILSFGNYRAQRSRIAKQAARPAV